MAKRPEEMTTDELYAELTRTDDDTSRDSRVSFLRNELTLWALGKHALLLVTVQQHLLELDERLQQHDL